jgi:hypothetical protein
MVPSVSMRASGRLGAVFILHTIILVAQEQTSSLTGKVRDVTGVGIPGVVLELKAEKAPSGEFRSAANSDGVYNFYGVPAGQYTLKLASPGFKWLTVKGTEIAAGEGKSLPPLQLNIGEVADCGGHGVLDYIRLLMPAGATGDLAGSVHADTAPVGGKTPPIGGAEVTLICGVSKVCGTTRTDANGAFLFKAQRPGYSSIRVRRQGYYEINLPGYTIVEGTASMYIPIFLERCPQGNCDPKRRPSKPMPQCE